MGKRFVVSNAWTLRVGMAAAGMLFGLTLGLVVAIGLLLCGYQEVSIGRSVLGASLIGIAAGLAYPCEVGSIVEAALHFSLGAVGTASGLPSASAEHSAPWLRRAAQAGSLVAVVGGVALWLFL